MGAGPRAVSFRGPCDQKAFTLVYSLLTILLHPLRGELLSCLKVPRGYILSILKIQRTSLLVLLTAAILVVLAVLAIHVGR